MTKFDEKFESNRLAMLVKQHTDIIGINGLVTFNAECTEDRLSSTSWVFSDEVLEKIDQTSFKLHLIELLDNFIQYRALNEKLPRKAGIVRFTTKKVAIEWLQDSTDLTNSSSSKTYSAPLINKYENILSTLNIEAFNLNEDKYSGVFLPVPFAEYWHAPLKVMLIGRETAGWNKNTVPPKNTIQRVASFSKDGNISALVSEAVGRYRKHLPVNRNGSVITTSRSRFKQYFFRLAKELNIQPKAIIYSNLFAWDYDTKSPKARPKTELNEITSLSKQLLTAQIEYLQPDVIVFAAGLTGVDPIIRELFEENFGGYDNLDIIPRKYWRFTAANATCFRIAHPRATSGHSKFRDKVIQHIKEM